MGKAEKTIKKRMSKTEKLEKQIANGKELLMRVTRRIAEKDARIHALEGQLKAAEAIIGYVMWEYCIGIEIKKEDLKRFIEEKSVSWSSTEDSFTIKITEAVKDADESEASRGSSQTKTDNGGASEGNPETTTTGEAE